MTISKIDIQRVQITQGNIIKILIEGMIITIEMILIIEIEI